MGRGSSGAGGGGSINPNVEKTLNKLIRQTANLKKEQYRIIDENGEVVFKRQGENDRVVMTVGEKRQYLDGATSLHNHPEVDGAMGGTFSPNDLSDFGYGARSINVSAPEGAYKLKNVNYGKPTQADGWRPLQDELYKIAEKNSSSDNLKKTNEIMQKSKIGKQMKSISNQWTKRRDEGASQSELQEIYNKYMSLEKEYKKQKAQVSRKLEVKPYHDFLKKNAKKYGFKYTYPKGAY